MELRNYGTLGDTALQNETRLDSIRSNNPKALRLVSEGSNIYYAVKRMMDFVIAFILLMFLSPLMLLVAVIIFIYSPGPIFFKQERVGARRQSHGGRSTWKRVNFQCYKFRTMKIDADPSVHQAYVKALIENDEAQMAALQGAPTQPRKLVNDTRIIRPGKFLRKLSLDELPQLWNVLEGHMSIVGPRPHALIHDYEYGKMIANYAFRHHVKPGITGWAQVHGFRGGTPRLELMEQRITLDLWYIANWSLALDIYVIIKTFSELIRRRNAY